MKKKLTFEICVYRGDTPLKAVCMEDWEEAKSSIDEYLKDHHNFKSKNHVEI